MLSLRSPGKFLFCPLSGSKGYAMKITTVGLSHRRDREITRAIRSKLSVDCVECMLQRYTRLNKELVERVKRENLKKQILPVLSEAIWGLSKVVHGFHKHYGTPN